MRSTSNVSSALAVILFASQAPATEFAENPARTRELIFATAARLGPGAVELAYAEAAYVYGRHPETAAPYMAACLKAVQAARIEALVPSQRLAVAR